MKRIAEEVVIISGVEALDSNCKNVIHAEKHDKKKHIVFVNVKCLPCNTVKDYCKEQTCGGEGEW